MEKTGYHPPKKQEKGKEEEEIGFSPHLRVEVLNALELPIADIGTRSSDPYVVVRFEGREFKTRVIFADLNPVWNEKTRFEVENPFSVVKFEVWDYDKLSHDDFLGQVSISLEEITPNDVMETEFKLENPKKKGNDAGSLFLRLHYHPGKDRLYPLSIDTLRGDTVHLKVPKDHRVCSAVEDVCRQLELPCPDCYALVEVVRQKKKIQENVLFGDVMIVKRMAEASMDYGGLSIALRLLRVVYPHPSSIRELEKKPLEFLFYQCFRELFRQKIRMPKDKYDEMVSNQDYLKILPQGVYDDFADPGRVDYQTRKSRRSRLSIRMEDDGGQGMAIPLMTSDTYVEMSTVGPDHQLDMGRKSDVMLHFLLELAKHTTSFSSVYEMKFFTKAYDPSGAALPSSVLLTISPWGLRIHKKNDTSVVLMTPFDYIVLWKESAVTFEFQDLRGDSYVLMTDESYQVAGTLDMYVQRILKNSEDPV
eukprot:TRINITY_DN2420_c0_g1_i1.p1 TRINITY_DN2420_c0_g1~~TRINITY_DN2420_c0_g1_i1.p1  ORF type:complete len:511 (+),score=145.54 TRINITY_DN2420_c0_g1_i1:104-1534(+)